MVTFQRPNVPRFSDPAPRDAIRTERIEPEPIPANVHPLFELGRDTYFELRGEPLRVCSVPALEGAALYELRARLASMRADTSDRPLTTEEYGAYCSIVRELHKRVMRLIRPVGLRNRVLRVFRLWRPLRYATDRDLGMILDFLLRLRAKSNTRFYSEMAISN